MKNFLFVWVSAFSLSLTSCFSIDNESQETEQLSMEPQEIKQGVVHRLFQRDHRTWTEFSVRLTDGKVIAGYSYDGNEIRQSQEEDFFFVQPGDTIVYSGEKVIEVRFKD